MTRSTRNCFECATAPPYRCITDSVMNISQREPYRAAIHPPSNFVERHAFCCTT